MTSSKTNKSNTTTNNNKMTRLSLAFTGGVGAGLVGSKGGMEEVEREPLHLIFNSESLIDNDGKDVLRQLSLVKKYKLPISNLSFFGNGNNKIQINNREMTTFISSMTEETTRSSNSNNGGIECRECFLQDCNEGHSRRRSIDNNNYFYNGRNTTTTTTTTTTSYPTENSQSTLLSSYQSLAKKLKRLATLEEFALSNMPNVGNYELSFLSPFLASNTSLRSLDLSGLNLAHQEGVMRSSLYEFLKNNTKLEVLSLGGNTRLGDGGINMIAEGLLLSSSTSTSSSSEKSKKYDKIKSSKSSSSGNGGSGGGGGVKIIKRINGVMKTKKDKRRRRMRVLGLENCGVGSEGVASIAGLLTHCPSLRVLELSHNAIGHVGIEHLAQSLKSSQCRLEYLGLNNIQVGDIGVKKLAQALLSSSSSFSNNSSSNQKMFTPALHTLSLQSNPLITNDGASSLLMTVYNSTSIQTILQSNHNLRAINLQGCSSITSPNLMKMAETLSSQCSILNTSEEVIRFKVSKYLKDASTIGNNEVLSEDLGEVFSDQVELMPYILSLVGAEGGFGQLYHVMKSWNMPLLYVHLSSSSSSSKKEGCRQEPVAHEDGVKTNKEEEKDTKKHQDEEEPSTNNGFQQFLEECHATTPPKNSKSDFRQFHNRLFSTARGNPFLECYKNYRNNHNVDDNSNGVNVMNNSNQLRDILSLHHGLHHGPTSLSSMILIPHHDRGGSTRVSANNYILESSSRGISSSRGNDDDEDVGINGDFLSIASSSSSRHFISPFSCFQESEGA